MISIVKQYSINQGPCFVGDVLQVKPTEYMVKIDAEKLPQSNVLTRGIAPARVAAHNLVFDRCVMGKIAFAGDFIMLYVSCERDPREFWSVTVTKGKKALLKVLSIDKAKKLFNELPRKMLSKSYLFNPEAYKVDIANLNKLNSDAKKQRKREREIAEWNAMGPLERMDRIPPWEGWD